MEAMVAWEAEEKKVEEEVSLLERPQWRPRLQTNSITVTNGNGSTGFKVDEGEEVNGIVLEESVLHMENNGGTETMKYREQELDAKLKKVDFQKILRSIIRHQDEETMKHEIISCEEEYMFFKLLSEGTKELVTINRLDHKEGDEEEDEVIEFEFERVVEKLDQHNVHCPNCKSRITKVVLRKKMRKDRVCDLFGCFSCFRIFIPTEDCFSPFRGIFQRPRNVGENGENLPQTSVVAANPSPTDSSDDQQGSSCLDLFLIFKKKPNIEPTKPAKDENESKKPGTEPQVDEQHVIDIYDKTDDNIMQEGVALPTKPVGQIGEIEDEKTEDNNIKQEGGAVPTKPEGQIEEIEDEKTEDDNIMQKGGAVPKKPEGQIEKIEDEKTGGTNKLVTTDESKGSEILKSIVYGGLMESITSLSVVSSAAAADATTVNIVAMGLANLIGGLFIIGPNLRELKNESPRRYKELLGRTKNFLLHATVAVLSFLIFGLIPPVTYGFSFRQSDDKDLKLVVVAAASLLCIAILATGKAYIQKSKPCTYIITVLYYVGMAVIASGISYGVGDLIKRLVEKLGWFDSSVAVTLSLPQVRSVSPAWGSH